MRKCGVKCKCVAVLTDEFKRLYSILYVPKKSYMYKKKKVKYVFVSSFIGNFCFGPYTLKSLFFVPNSFCVLVLVSNVRSIVS
jgi:hypothetical protein